MTRNIIYLHKTELTYNGRRVTTSFIDKKSPANAKGNAPQRCMFKGPVRTKSKLTDPSNDVLFTLAKERDRSRAAVLAKNRKFFLPSVI